MVRIGIMFQFQDRNSMSQLVGYYQYVKSVTAVVYMHVEILCGTYTG